jgi:membrane-associated phospholipid phosphatase
LLVACVVLGLVDGVDRRVFAFVRPHDEWGAGQVSWATVVEGLRPPVVGAALALVAVSVCLVRRSLRSAVVPVVAGAVGVGVTLLVKIALARPDPHLTGSGHGGSFPSGHTLGVVVCVGLAVQLLRPGAGRWAWAAAAAAGAVMGAALVVIGAHWATDVLGGLLLGLAVVSGATTTGPGRGEAAGDLSGRDQVTGRPVS